MTDERVDQLVAAVGRAHESCARLVEDMRVAYEEFRLQAPERVRQLEAELTVAHAVAGALTGEDEPDVGVLDRELTVALELIPGLGSDIATAYSMARAHIGASAAHTPTAVRLSAVLAHAVQLARDLR
ncbi:MAG TPA: hypothetical protein VEO01_39765 [Pseudonocardiaceae bacterium]|nr:hypothetical protein [Pseudonocardiaceae bacterium]